MPHDRANGLDIHYTVEGEGPPLIMLHGASSSAVEDWGHQRALFRQSFTCYLVDARGHAGTYWDGEGAWSRDTLVEDLRAFADALDLATFHVAGFSMGAITALAFATRDPARLASALIAPATDSTLGGLALTVTATAPGSLGTFTYVPGVAARLDAASNVQRGRKARLWYDTSKVHVFDTASGKNLVANA